MRALISKSMGWGLFLNRIVPAALMLLAFSGSPQLVQAQKQWTGAANQQWNNAANWIGGVPVSGDAIQFNIPGALNWSTSNDLSGLTLGGFAVENGLCPSIEGLPLTLSGDIQIGNQGMDFTIYTRLGLDSGTPIPNRIWNVNAGSTLGLWDLADGEADVNKNGCGLLTLGDGWNYFRHSIHSLAINRGAVWQSMASLGDPLAHARLELPDGLAIHDGGQYVDWIESTDVSVPKPVWQLTGRVTVDGGAIRGVKSLDHVLAVTLKNDGLIDVSQGRLFTEDFQLQSGIVTSDDLLATATSLGTYNTMDLKKTGTGTAALMVPTAVSTAEIDGGLLILRGGSVSKTGRLNSADDLIWLNSGGILRLDNTNAAGGNVNGRIDAGDFVLLNGGNLWIRANEAADTSETINVLELHGGSSTITLQAQTATQSTLTAVSLSRIIGHGVALVRGDSLGLGGAGVGGTSRLLFTVAPTLSQPDDLGTPKAGIIPCLVAGSNPWAVASELTTYDVNGVRSLNPATEYSNDAFAVDANVKLTADNTVPAGANTIQALVLNTTLGSIDLTTNVPLTVQSSMLTAFHFAPTSIVGTGSLTFGPNAATGYEGIVYTDADLDIQVPIQNNGANAVSLTKGGPGKLTLSGNNTLTGYVSVAGGRLVLNHANALGSPTNPAGIRAYGGVLDLNGYTAPVNFVSLDNNGSIVGGTLASRGTYSVMDGRIDAQLANFSPTTIVDLQKSGPGTVVLNGNNSYGGLSGTIMFGTVIVDGTLVVSRNANLGHPVGSLKFSSPGGTLQFAQPFDVSSRSIIIDNLATASFDTHGYDITFANSISGGGAGNLIKTGLGRLTLAVPSFYTGNTSVTGGTLALGAAGAIPNTNLTVAGPLVDGLETPATLNLGATNTTVASVTLDNGGRIVGPGTLSAPGGFQLYQGTIDARLVGAGAVNVSPTRALCEGGGLVVLNGQNNYAGTTTVGGSALGGGIGWSNAVLRANDGMGLSPALLVLSDGGVLEMAPVPAPNPAFSRTISVGVNLNGGSHGAGFSASGVGTVDVNLQNPAGGAVPWGAAGFTTPVLVLNELTASTTLNMKNSLLLQPPGGNASRKIAVNALPEYWAAITGAISDGAADVDLEKIGRGTLILDPAGSAANSYSGQTIVTEGVLFAKEAWGLPAGSNLKLNGGAWGGNGNFTRNIGALPGQVQFTANGGGFSARSGTLNVNLGPMGGGATLVWGVDLNGPLTLNAPGADSPIKLQNNLNLSAAARTVYAHSNVATVLGSVINGNLIKDGPGILVLAGPANLYSDTTIRSGTLVMGHATALGSNNLTLTGYGQNSSPTLDMGDYSYTIKQLTMNYFGRILGTGNLTSLSDIQIQGGTVKVNLLGGPGVKLVKSRYTPFELGSSIPPFEFDLAVLQGTNNYGGLTSIEGGTLRAEHGVGIPAGSGITLNGGVWESANGTNRQWGTGAGQLQIPDGDSGFSAYGSATGATIDLKDAAGGTATLDWTVNDYSGAPWFEPTIRPDRLILNSYGANSNLLFKNPLKLGYRPHPILVDAELAYPATMQGKLSSHPLEDPDWGIIKDGRGMLVLAPLTGLNNTYVGATKIIGGVLRAEEGLGLPVNSNLIIQGDQRIEGYRVVKQAVFESRFNLDRPLGVGPVGQVQVPSGNSGFSAYSNNITVTLRRAADGVAIVSWGDPTYYFNPQELILNAVTADKMLTFASKLDLRGEDRLIRVDAASDWNKRAIISNVVSNGMNAPAGLIKIGQGILDLTAINSYDGVTTIEEGTLALSGSGQISNSSLIVNNATFLIADGAALHTVNDIIGTGDTVLNPSAQLTATRVVQGTVTVGAGGILTIAPAPGAAGGAVTPVPEPGAFLLLALAGLSAFPTVCRRKRNSPKRL